MASPAHLKPQSTSKILGFDGVVDVLLVPCHGDGYWFGLTNPSAGIQAKAVIE
jgi:hypothetical protein